MNYQIITNPTLLERFIEWLPALESHEKYYLCLFARNKYTKHLKLSEQVAHIKSDKAQLKRFVTDKERMYNKICQLEIGLGKYHYQRKPVPQEALALYITVNPRDMRKATVNTMVKLAQSIRDQNIELNPHQEALSEIQKSKSRNCFVAFDVDDKTTSVDRIRQVVYDCAQSKEVRFKLLETRGGYHLLVDPSSIPIGSKHSWYVYLKLWLTVDQAGDLMIPVPGTYQGGFTPYFITD